MNETEKKDEGQKCCCCQCWKTIFIAIALLAIGAAFGHVMTMKCCPMMGPGGGGHGMKACWDRGDRGREGGWGHKFDVGKCKPGCTCPVCSRKAALPDPNQASCPKMGKKAGKSREF